MIERDRATSSAIERDPIMADRSNPVSSALFDLRVGFPFSVFRSPSRREETRTRPPLSIAVNDACLKN
jgi:hypothetical protein